MLDGAIDEKQTSKAGGFPDQNASPNQADQGAGSLILEVALLRIRGSESKAFESAFLKAQKIISATPGYLSHELQRCLERESEYVLLVRWQSVEAHEVGFRGSAEYQEWKQLLHHYYDPFPTVLHYEPVAGAIGASSGSGSQ